MEQLRPICVVSYGLGATGKTIARLVHKTPGLQLVGGIDQDPSLVGRDLGEVLELGQSLGMLISDHAESVLNATRPDVAVVATRSLLKQAYPQLAACLKARVNVVSTCEELVYPCGTQIELAQSLNDLARQGNASILGIGVNPGFIMDLLPLILTAPCMSVSRILVTRMVDATLRRASLHQRIGAGLTPVQFREHIAEISHRHIGLCESLHMIADTIGWNIERVDERIEPIMTDEWIHTEPIVVAPGQVAGVHQVVTGIVNGQEVLVLDWRTALGAQETFDAITIEGEPPIHLRIEGGLHGDKAAAAMVLHAIKPVVEAPSGLLNVTQIAPTHYHV